MAYLLTQIVFSLVFAGVLGAAVGWLLHGFRATNKIDQFKAEFRQQSLALSQAETDNKMIEDDFRELKYRSEKTIALLEEDTKQLPELKKNLEKSQTLVRQLLQKHDAELRHLSAENGVLTSKVRELENREKAVTRLQMDLNTERLKMRTGADSKKSDEKNSNKNSAAETTPSMLNVVPASLSPANEPKQKAPKQTNPEQTEFSLDAQSNDTNVALENNSQEHINQASFDEVLDKADNVLTRFQDDPEIELASFQREIDQELDDIRSDLSMDDLDPALSGEASDKIPTLQTSKTQASDKPSFADATGRDDLQEIFGIGPVTENTLNSMGIQCFEQIALFEREHIEYVAEVLQIFPGRIERDNWVASARKLVASREATSHSLDTPPRELEDA